MLKRLAPLLVATVLLAGGCAAETIPEAEKILIESSSSPLGPGAVDGKVEKKRAKAKKNKKVRGNVIVSPGVGLQFKAPKGWAVVTPADIDAERYAPYLESSGITVDQFRSTMAKTDVFLLGMTGTLNVIAAGTAQVLPSSEEFRSNLAAGGLNVTTIEDVSTRFGTGRAAFYSIQAGAQTAHGVSLFVLVDGKVSDITISTKDLATTRAVLSDVAKTLKRA